MNEMSFKTGFTRFMQGNEAIVEGAIAAGAKFFAGYPITPSTEIAQLASRRLPEENGCYIQMEDEIASMAAIVGASMAGKQSFTATSGPGFSLMQENLGAAVILEAPCVIVNVQRTGPSTGNATKTAQGDIMQARWGRHGDQAIIALSPSSVQECFTLTYVAFQLSEQFRVPVILLSDQITGHLRETLRIPNQSELPPVSRKLYHGDPEKYRPFAPDKDGIPGFANYGGEAVFHATTTMHDETGKADRTPQNTQKQVSRLMDKIYGNLDKIVMFKEFYTENAEILIISYGYTARSARKAALLAKDIGLRVGVLQLISIWPFADKIVKRVAGHVKTIFVAEMNMGQIILEVKRVLGPQQDIRGILKVTGEAITPEEIFEKLKETDDGKQKLS